MEKLVKVPFDVETSKKIQSGEIEGRIVTRDDKSVRIVCFDAKQDDSIVALISYDNVERVKSYAKDGMVFQEGTSPIDLMLEIPEYMTFKDGDVLVSYEGVVLLFDGTVNQYDLCGCYCSLYCDSHDLDLNYDYKGVFHGTRKANKDERNEMINKLKSSGVQKAKECLKKLGIEEKPKCEFKPFDKVLVRNTDDQRWCISFFAYYLNHVDLKFCCLSGGYWKQCVKYEGNERLLGTTDKPE